MDNKNWLHKQTKAAKKSIKTWPNWMKNAAKIDSYKRRKK